MKPTGGLSVQVRRALEVRDGRLSRRAVSSIASSLGELSRRWLRPGDGYRRRAIQRLVKDGYAPPAARALLEALFGAMTERDLFRMLSQEFGRPRVLDALTPDESGTRLVRAYGPRLITHFLPGNLPNPAIDGIVCGLLVKSANALKVSARDAGVTELYLRSLAERDRDLAASCVRLDPASHAHALRIARASDLVVVTGTDETLRTVRRHLDGSVPVIGYGHRISAALVTREALRRASLTGLAARTARDVWTAEQRGCLSCVLVEVERGGECAPPEFARRLADELDAQDRRSPSTPRSLRGIRLKAQLRSEWAVRRVRGEDVRCLESRPPGRWQVLYEAKPSGALPLAGEWTVLVRAFRGDEWESHLRPLRAHVQAAALEAPPSRVRVLAERLASLGFSRVTRAGLLQSPPLSWHRDGRPVLADWVRWTDVDRVGRASR